MVLDSATVYLKDTHYKSARVTFKDGGYIGVNDGNGWMYFPPHRVESIESDNKA